MKDVPVRELRLADINERAERPAKFIEQEDARYFAEVDRMARQLQSDGGHVLVMLSGPSSSGKTTTAFNLQKRLCALGTQAHVVSLDDFYRGRGLAPQLPDGSFDYESPDALDLPQLARCMRELAEEGEAQLPVFDFTSGRPAAETRTLTLPQQAVVIFEGIHALSPSLRLELPSGTVHKLFVNTLSRVVDDEGKVLARRDIRLTRRLLRDERFRACPVEETLHMWQQVTRGEELYLFPHTDDVDMIIDTTLAYEPCLLGPELLPQLRRVSRDHPFYPAAEQLLQALPRFRQIPAEQLSKDSLLHEFLG